MWSKKYVNLEHLNSVKNWERGFIKLNFYLQTRMLTKTLFLNRLASKWSFHLFKTPQHKENWNIKHKQSVWNRIALTTSKIKQVLSPDPITRSWQPLGNLHTNLTFGGIQEMFLKHVPYYLLLIIKNELRFFVNY